jgi:hypothetical protein
MSVIVVMTMMVVFGIRACLWLEWGIQHRDPAAKLANHIVQNVIVQVRKLFSPHLHPDMSVAQVIGHAGKLPWIVTGYSGDRLVSRLNFHGVATFRRQDVAAAQHRAAWQLDAIELARFAAHPLPGFLTVPERQLYCVINALSLLDATAER